LPVTLPATMAPSEPPLDAHMECMSDININAKKRAAQVISSMA
jgi:hypothetical protein